ncbi:hypothetical protein PMIN04_012754 [Paraphaeosphaeria minitans]
MAHGQNSATWVQPSPHAEKLHAHTAHQHPRRLALVVLVVVVVVLTPQQHSHTRHIRHTRPRLSHASDGDPIPAIPIPIPISIPPVLYSRHINRPHPNPLVVPPRNQQHPALPRDHGASRHSRCVRADYDDGDAGPRHIAAVGRAPRESEGERAVVAAADDENDVVFGGVGDRGKRFGGGLVE